jgi:AcrR family transcriptional regulator
MASTVGVELDAEPSDGRLLRGIQTRSAILAAACADATRTGLEGLSLGRLADEVGLSKSGVFAQFGSKEELQLAVIEGARRRFVAEVAVPADREKSPLRRLWVLCSRRLEHMRTAYPGGCFFASVNAEYGARPGPIRDRLVAIREEWLHTLVGAVQLAVRSGELRRAVDASVLARQLDALASSANGDALLLSDDKAFKLAARTTLELLRRSAEDPSVLPQRVRLTL